MNPHTFTILLIVMLIVAFMIGAIPFAYILAKRLKGVDIRKVGSGNVGATNASRVLGRPIGFLVLLLDVTKGMFPVFLGSLVLNRPYPAYPWALADPKSQLVVFGIGMAAFLGHCFNPFLRFKGGKGGVDRFGCFSDVGSFGGAPDVCGLHDYDRNHAAGFSGVDHGGDFVADFDYRVRSHAGTSQDSMDNRGAYNFVERFGDSASPREYQASSGG